MKALRLRRGEARLDEHVPVPEPGPGQVRVRIIRAAVGRTAIEVAGDPARRHEDATLGGLACGTVEAAGRGVAAAWTGARVAFPVHAWCGACDRCRRGLRDHCRERTLLGMDGRDGVLAERAIVDAIGLVRVPDSLDDDQAALAGVIAAALRIVRRADAAAGPFVTVLGDGPLGLAVLQLLAPRREGVRLVGASAAGLAAAARLGLRHRAVREIGRRGDQDLVIDATGRAGGLLDALDLVRPGGTILRPGLEPRPVDPARGLPPDRLARDEVSLVGCGFGPVDRAIDALARGEADVAPLIGSRMRLADGPELVRTRARDGALEVLVAP